MRRLTLLTLLVLTLAGCSQRGDTSGPGPKAGKGVIGLSVLTLANPFFKEIADTLTAEAAKGGYEVVVVDGDNNVARQQNQVKDFIVRKVSAIVLCPCD